MRWTIKFILGMCLCSVIQAQDLGVTLYEEAGYQGRKQTFYATVDNLRHSRIGNDRAVSIRVPAGIKVTLYEHQNFRGRYVVLAHSVPNLGRTALGNNRLSSMKIEFLKTERHGGTHSVVLFEHEDFKGRYTRCDRDLPSLAGTEVGNRALSSIRIPAGFVVTLFGGEFYRGRSVRLTSSVTRLKKTALGNDRARSIRIESGFDAEPQPRAIVLYEYENFRGRDWTCRKDTVSLVESPLGNRIGSAKIPVGAQLTFFDREGFSGRAVTLTGHQADLGRLPLRQLASLQVTLPGPERYEVEAAPFEDVLLFEHAGFRGIHIPCNRSLTTLSGTPLAFKLSSVRVPEGYQVTLYSGDRFRGRRLKLTGDIADLKGSAVGNDAVRSIRVTRPEPAHNPSKNVVLFEHADYGGYRLVCTRDLVSLSNTPLLDRVSSIQVPHGFTVTLFTREYFRGRSLILRKDHRFLKGTAIGNDRVASLKIEREHPGRFEPPKGRAALFEHDRFRGRKLVCDSDVADLATSNFDRMLSSIQVEPGFYATLFDGVGFQGRAISIEGNLTRLKKTLVGNDAVRSVRIRPLPENELHGDPKDQEHQEYPGERETHDEHDRNPYHESPTGSEEDVVILFTESHYRGQAISYHESSQTVAPFIRRRLGSIKIPPHHTVTLYPGEKFRGKPMVLRGSIADMHTRSTAMETVGSLIIQRTR